MTEEMNQATNMERREIKMNKCKEIKSSSTSTHEVFTILNKKINNNKIVYNLIIFRIPYCNKTNSKNDTDLFYIM